MISIIIVTFNSGKVIENCLNSILNSQLQPLEYEIIVIDNNSSDNTKDLLKGYSASNIQIILNMENLGFARACNQGVRMAKHQTVLLLNPDTIVKQHSIRDSYRFLHSSRNIGIVGCKILDKDGKIIKSCRYFPTISDALSRALGLYKIFPGSRMFGRVMLSNFDYMQNREVDVVSGAFLMFKKKVTEDIGLFDEGYFLYTEEVDFCYRAKQAGWKIFYYAGAEIWHQEGHSAQNEAAYVSTFIQQHRSNHLFYKKYYPAIQRKLFWILGFTEVSIRAAFWSLCFLLTGSKRAKRKYFRYRGVAHWYLHQYKTDIG